VEEARARIAYQQPVATQHLTVLNSIVGALLVVVASWAVGHFLHRDRRSGHVLTVPTRRRGDIRETVDRQLR
jgi:hypothetical protein